MNDDEKIEDLMTRNKKMNGLFREFTDEDSGINVLDLANGQRLIRFHTKGVCSGDCPIHKPTNHHMVKWPLNWRHDRFIFERMCPHGIGHPDPDSLAFTPNDPGIHGCDGCCNDIKCENFHEVIDTTSTEKPLGGEVPCLNHKKD
jgi:hypothetical protein